jgi:hypothetical protein
MLDDNFGCSDGIVDQFESVDTTGGGGGIGLM